MNRQRLILTAGFVALTGCGLKGPLTLPEKSSDIVIREPAAAVETAVPASPEEAVQATKPATEEEKSRENQP